VRDPLTPDDLEPAAFDEPDPIRPHGAIRRIAMAAIVVALILSMIFLAFVSGRGVVRPEPPSRNVPTPGIAIVDRTPDH
jgi:hypothetical protein